MSEHRPPIQKTDAEWQAELSDAQYTVMRCGGTEPPFSGPFWDNKAPGLYSCAGCGAPLFDAATKYDSGTGWPSFYQAVSETAVTDREDLSHGMRRVESVCAQCDGHLGHVFPDGPPPTGLRYCINGHALTFTPSGETR